MDVKIIRNRRSLVTSVYRKPCQPLVVNRYHSLQPMRIKRNLVIGMLNRARKICSDEELFNLEVPLIEKCLTNSGYPRNFIQKQFSTFFSKEKCTKIGTEKEEGAIYFGLEYSGGTTSKFLTNASTIVKNVFTLSKPVKIYYRNKRKLLHRFSSKYKDRTKSSMGCVYKLTCEDCGESYIGETGRKLDVRMSEHQRYVRNKEGSAIAEHICNTGHKVDFTSPTVLKYEDNLIKRNIYESIFIDQNKLVQGNKKSIALYLSRI